MKYAAGEYAVKFMQVKDISGAKNIRARRNGEDCLQNEDPGANSDHGPGPQGDGRQQLRRA